MTEEQIKKRIAELEALLLEIAPPLNAHLNPNQETEGRKVGFLVCAFDFGDGGTALAYLTNAQAPDMANALIELCERLGATARVVTPRPRGQG